MREVVLVRHTVPFALCLAALLVAWPGVAVAQSDAAIPVVVQDLLDQGNNHRQAGRLDRAIEAYRQAVERAPELVAAHASLGAALVESGDLAAALAAFEAGLRQLPDDRALLFNAAVVARRLEETERALAHAAKGVAEHPKDVPLRLLQASLLDRLDRVDEAVVALEAARDLTPNDAQTLYRLGNQYHRANRLEQSVDAYRQAIRKDKKLLPAHFNLGAVLFELGRLDEALEAYQIALEPIEKAFRSGDPVDPVNALAYRNLGAIYLQSEQFAKAADAYAKARQLAPSDPQVLYNQGFASFKLSRWDDAREAYESALQLDPELSLAYLHLGQIAMRKGQPVEAIARLEAGVPKLSGDSQTEALRVLADAYRDAGRGGDAETAYRKVLESSGDDPAILLALGRLARQDGRTTEARSLLERARQVAPGDVEVGLELAGVLGQTDDTAAQKALYGQLLTGGKAASLWRVRLALALLELAEGNAEAATGHLDQLAEAAEVDAESRAVVAALRGVLRAESGDLEGARKLLRQASSSKSVAAADALAVVDALAGRGGEAVGTLQASLQEEGDAKTPVASALRLDTGLLLWSLGRHQEAQPHLRAAFAASPNEPSLLAAMGDLALRDDDIFRAIEHFGRAEELCRSGGGRAAPSADTGRVFQVQLSTAGAVKNLCAWVERAVGATRVAAAVETLPAALAGRSDPRATRSLVEAALTTPLGNDLRAAALFVRGTLRLDAGDVAGAAQDLSGAVDGTLPAALQPHAHNNLGVAYARQGRGAEARAQMELARSATSTAQPATLNLAILYDDVLDDGRRALELYDAYARAGGSRRDEVRAWADRLRELYP